MGNNISEQLAPQHTDNSIAVQVTAQDADEFLNERYLSYSQHVVQQRALVRSDGLKPVQRRILFAMLKANLLPDRPHMKAATIAGRVMEYHPHGDAPIVDAMETLTVTHTMRVPLLDPHGSMGNNFGNRPPSARYWEARLSAAGYELVKDTPEHALPMGLNYSGEMPEPKLIPSRFPVDIINGSQGIAVGFAANIFTHNPTEVMNACIALNNNPDMSLEELMKIVPGPDFPTGGTVTNIEGIEDYYRTGKGTITLTGIYQVNDIGRGKKQIVFTEIPYKVDINKLVASTKEHAEKGTPGFEGISSVKDLSDLRNRTRIAIETKQGADHQVVLDALLKKANFRTKLSANMTVLIGDTPQQAGMLTILREFLTMRRTCVTNKTLYQLGVIDKKLESLSALAAVLLDLDKAISIIRNGKNTDDANKNLRQAFNISESQATYVLSVPLRRLTQADRDDILQQTNKLKEEKTRLETILSSEEELNNQVEQELQETLQVISDPRRTIIDGRTAEEVKTAEKEAQQRTKLLSSNAPVHITRFTDGTVLRTLEPQTTQKLVEETVTAKSLDDIVLIAEDGTGYRTPIMTLSEDTPYDFDTLGIPSDNPKIMGFALEKPETPATGVMIVTAHGKIKISRTDYVASRNEFPTITLDSGDTIVACRWVTGSLEDKRILLGSTEYNTLAFDATEVRPSGSKAGGVAGMKLKPGGTVAAAAITNNPNTTLVSTSTNNTTKVTAANDIPLKKRGGQGVNIHKQLKKDTEFINMYIGENIVHHTINGEPAESPAVTPRAHSGTRTETPLIAGSKTTTA